MESSKFIIPSLPFSPGGQFVSFSLDASTGDHQLMLLPDEHELIINVQSGHFVVVNWDDRYIALDGQFHEHELPLMLAVLNAWPSYVPVKKVLYAIFDQSIEDIEELVAIDQVAVMTTVEHLVRTCNAQLAPLGITIQKIEDVGYKLSSLITNEQRQRDQQIRLEQAEARRQADQALRAAGRAWISGEER